jgi:hypothetical protein
LSNGRWLLVTVLYETRGLCAVGPRKTIPLLVVSPSTGSRASLERDPEVSVRKVRAEYVQAFNGCILESGKDGVHLQRESRYDRYDDL